MTWDEAGIRFHLSMHHRITLLLGLSISTLALGIWLFGWQTPRPEHAPSAVGQELPLRTEQTQHGSEDQDLLSTMIARAESPPNEGEEKLTISGRVVDADFRHGISAIVRCGGRECAVTASGGFTLGECRATDVVTVSSHGYQSHECAVGEWPATSVIPLKALSQSTILVQRPDSTAATGAYVYCWLNVDAWDSEPGTARLLGRTDADGELSTPLPPDSVIMALSPDACSEPMQIIAPASRVRIELSRGGRIGLSIGGTGKLDVTMLSPHRSAMMPVKLDPTGASALMLPPGTYRVVQDRVAVAGGARVKTGQTTWLQVPKTETWNVRVVDAATSDDLAPTGCHVTRLIEYAGNRLVPNATVMARVGEKGILNFSMPQIGADDHVRYRVKVPGYRDAEFYADGAVGGHMTLVLHPEPERVLIVVTADSDSHLSLRVEDVNASGLTLARIEVYDGRGSSEIAGEWTGKRLYLGSLPIGQDLMVFDPMKNEVHVDLSGQLGTIACRGAPPDLMLVAQGHLLGGIGVDVNRVEWRALPPGHYFLMPRRYMFQGAADRGVAVDLEDSSTLVVDWDDPGDFEGHVLAEDPASLLAAPLVSTISGVHPLFDMATRINGDGHFLLRPGFEIEDVAVCRSLDGRWQILATGGTRHQIAVDMPRSVELVGELSESWDQETSASAELHGTDWRGRRVLEFELRLAHRVGQRMVIDNVPAWIREITVDACGRRWIGKLAPDDNTCRLSLRQ